jgi:NTP pyrophosphatase (non-canonical NTP hydrolase)
MNSMVHQKECVGWCEDTPNTEKQCMSYEELQLDHAADGLVTEAGEFKDILKRRKYYGKEIDVVNAKEELGDALWYINFACRVLGTTIEELLEINHRKLKSRYPEKFTQHHALNRDLEAERKILETKDSAPSHS